MIPGRTTISNYLVYCYLSHHHLVAFIVKVTISKVSVQLTSLVTFRPVTRLSFSPETKTQKVEDVIGPKSIK